MAGTFVQLQLKFNCLLGVPAWPSGPQPNRAGFLPLPEISSNMPLASKPSFRRRLMLLASGNFAVLCGLPCGLPDRLFALSLQQSVHWETGAASHMRP